MVAEQCAFGHERHDKILAGMWTGYAWQKYLDLPGGWCPGRCDISRTLDLYGVWEWADTKRFLRCLLKEPCRAEERVIDVGANIGWYSIWAGLCGFEVQAIEGEAESIEIIRTNASTFGVEAAVEPICFWVDEHMIPSFNLNPVRVLKIDIEGLEYEAVRVFSPLLEERLVEYAMIEVSPVFKDVAAETARMVEQMLAYGYSADVDGVRFGVGDLQNIDQANVWFERRR